MKSIIIYYSMTGNTKKIAEAIHAGMRLGGESCDIVRLRDVSPQDLVDYDLIGLGSPVINQQEPPNVSSFIQQTMKSVNGKHGFAFCTHGASPCRYLASVVPAMAQRGLIIIGWNDWFCSAYYPTIPKPYFTDGHPDAIDLKEAEDFGRAMAERSRRIYQGEIQVIPAFPKGREYDEIYEPPEAWPWAFPEVMEYGKVMHSIPFTINREKCLYPKCRHCIDNCPAHNIGPSASGPVYHSNCTYCYLCEQTCPRGAIETDYETLEKAHYKMVKTWLKKSVDVFEARGKLRRLVPDKDIGWDTAFWKRKAPRFKIA
jgi:NAD-dependent dihydropyrimidine dehydrogenase PreA subunit/multimeric flavodoxin WrbA